MKMAKNPHRRLVVLEHRLARLRRVAGPQRNLPPRHVVDHERRAFMRDNDLRLGLGVGVNGVIHLTVGEFLMWEPILPFVTTFAIINIPFPGQRIKPPYVAAYVLLDGADVSARVVGDIVKSASIPQVTIAVGLGADGNIYVIDGIRDKRGEALSSVVRTMRSPEGSGEIGQGSLDGNPLPAMESGEAAA